MENQEQLSLNSKNLLTLQDKTIMMENLLPEPGTYIIVLRIENPVKIRIGKLGHFLFNKGYYLYTGSAHGPGGIKSRVTRHIKKKKTKRWHIDYLGSAGKITDIFLSYSTTKIECFWAEILDSQPYTSIPVKGFGSSDCLCISHLFYTDKVKHLKDLKTVLQNTVEVFNAVKP